MLELKDYQVKSLEALESYLRLTAEYGARIAFEEKLHRDYRKVPFLPELPYVCLRVPTGGGKTLMACHALGIAARELLHQDRAFCLWLVPSNAIKDQTLAALRDRGHAYRQALESQFSGMVTVLDLTEALFVKRGDIAGETVIIVSTIQALRADDTEGRKVYESAGALQHHFDGLPGEIRDSLERGEKGTIAYSLANVMRLNRPVVIMDEAHNARTHRSFEMLARVNPAAIIEFTATPETVHDPDNARYASNILYHVSAAELKSENMVKLPIKVNNRAEWKEAVAGAVQLRQELEAKAQIEEKATREYLRPITLYQAQERSQHRETITVDVLKKCLMEDFKVPEEEIAIATGQIREIDDVNLFQRECPIRHIITVKALREGWDCSFAYILCTVSTTAAAGAVEQILGRIMRMPGAKRKQQDELNFSYAFCASPKFQDAIGTLETALVECGFERLEARDLIKPAVKPVEGFFSLFDYYNKVETPVGEMPNLSRLTPVLKKQFEYKSEDGVIQFAGAMTDKQENELQRCFKTPEGKAAVETLKELSRRRVSDDDYPAGRGEIFQVPALSIRVDGQLELFEDHHFLDREFKLSECDATFSEQLFPQQAKSGDSAEVDVNEAGRLEIKHVEELQRQLNWLSGEKGWELPELVNWLDRHIPHPDITRTESTLFINSALSHLLEKRNFTIEQLAGRKYQLQRAMEARIDEHRRQTAKEMFQQLLFPQGATEIEVDPEIVFTFDEYRYAYNWPYIGRIRLPKHFFKHIGELESEGEEFSCAQYISLLPEVKFWVRNMSKRDCSFWLPTSTDKFYPDFIAKLIDDRILVVECKGEHLWSNDDSKEKRDIGALWASRSNGQCIFVMPNGEDWKAIEEAIRKKPAGSY